MRRGQRSTRVALKEEATEEQESMREGEKRSGVKHPRFAGSGTMGSRTRKRGGHTVATTTSGVTNLAEDFLSIPRGSKSLDSLL